MQLPTGAERDAAQRASAYTQKVHVRARLISAETQQPVPNAIVSVMPPLRNGYARSGPTVLTDAEGYFEVPLPDSLVDQPARLVVVHVKYARQQVPLQAGAYPEVIELLPAPPPVTISTGGLVVVKRKWWQFWRKSGSG